MTIASPIESIDSRHPLEIALGEAKPLSERQQKLLDASPASAHR